MGSDKKNNRGDIPSDENAFDEVFVDFDSEVDIVQAEIVDTDAEYVVEALAIESEYDVDVVDVELETEYEPVALAQPDQGQINTERSEPADTGDINGSGIKQQKRLESDDEETELDEPLGESSVINSSYFDSVNAPDAVEEDNESSATDNRSKMKMTLKADPLGLVVLSLFLIFGLLIIGYLVKIFF